MSDWKEFTAVSAIIFALMYILQWLLKTLTRLIFRKNGKNNERPGSDES